MRTGKMETEKESTISVGAGNLPDILGPSIRNQPVDETEHAGESELQQSAQSRNRGRSEICAPAITSVMGAQVQEILRARLREMVDEELDRVHKTLLRKTSKDEITSRQR